MEWESNYEIIKGRVLMHVIQRLMGACAHACDVGILPIMWLPLSKKMAAMVGCWWQPTTIV
jgi:hypothetical protein